MQGVIDREIEFDPYKNDDYYWTSSVYYPNQKYAFLVNFGTGHSRSDTKRLKLFYVRCVRGGSPEQQAVLKRKPESKQSAKSPAGTVTDTSTGLMWQKKPFGGAARLVESEDLLQLPVPGGSSGLEAAEPG